MQRVAQVVLMVMVIVIPQICLAGDACFYGALQGGYFIPNNDREGMKDFDSNARFGLAGGFRFTPYTAIEVGVDYGAVRRKNTVYVIDNLTIVTWSIPLTAKIIVPIVEGLEAYAGFGKTRYDNEFKMKSSSLNINQTADGWCWGYHAVAGVDFRVDPTWALGMGLKWEKARQEIDINNSTATEKINVGGATFLFTMKYYL